MWMNTNKTKQNCYPCIYLTLQSRITHESASTYFQWGPLVLLKRQQAEETVLGYKESGCDTLALCE